MKIELLLGLYGSLTGTAALIVNYANRVSSIKNRRADLLIRFQTMINNTKSICGNFDKLSLKAERSRAARLAASGNYGGGGHQRWKNELSEDRIAVGSIKQELDELEKRAKETTKYEDLIVQIDQHEKVASMIKAKYEKSILDDKQYSAQNHK